MKNILEVMEGTCGKLVTLNGSKRFLSRISAIGLTPGTTLKVIKNCKRKLVLLYSRDTLIAINREECKQIFMEVQHEPK